MSPVGLEPTMSKGERPQTYALDRAATGTGNFPILLVLIMETKCFLQSKKLIFKYVWMNYRLKSV